MTLTRTPTHRPAAKKSATRTLTSPAKKRTPAPRPARPGVNLALLRKVRQRILRYPEKYDQSTFCGSRFCIAGHAILAGGTESQKRKFRKEMRGEETLQQVDKVAATLLRISPQESERLFSGAFPDEILEQIPWTDGDATPRARDKFWASRGAARIDLFISSKGRK